MNNWNWLALGMTLLLLIISYRYGLKTPDNDAPMKSKELKVRIAGYAAILTFIAIGMSGRTREGMFILAFFGLPIASLIFETWGSLDRDSITSRKPKADDP
ncbi:MAG: hypothetical protein AAB669_03175 [Patescibacteria group bacterium]